MRSARTPPNSAPTAAEASSSVSNSFRGLKPKHRTCSSSTGPPSPNYGCSLPSTCSESKSTPEAPLRDERCGGMFVLQPSQDSGGDESAAGCSCPCKPEFTRLTRAWPEDDRIVTCSENDLEEKQRMIICDMPQASTSLLLCQVSVLDKKRKVLAVPAHLPVVETIHLEEEVPETHQGPRHAHDTLVHTVFGAA